MGCKCTECGGTAEIDCPDCVGGEDRYAVGETEVVCDCRTCRGRARLWCSRCDGTGEEPIGATDDELDVDAVQAALADRSAVRAEDIDAFAAEELAPQVAA